jgi:hypothetical protein
MSCSMSAKTVSPLATTYSTPPLRLSSSPGSSWSSHRPLSEAFSSSRRTRHLVQRRALRHVRRHSKKARIR